MWRTLKITTDLQQNKYTHSYSRAGASKNSQKDKNVNCFQVIAHMSFLNFAQHVRTLIKHRALNIINLNIL